jgi:GNAT superfamily N-acetyltransferase
LCARRCSRRSRSTPWWASSCSRGKNGRLSTTAENARKLAEDPFAYTPLWPAFEREEHDGYVLFHGPGRHHWFALALRLRLGTNVEPSVQTVRAWFRERGRREFTWTVSDSSTPTDLRERLLALGAQPDPAEPLMAGMVLTREPPAREGIEVRPVATFDEYAAVRELGWDLLGMSEGDRREARGRLQASWAEYADVDIVNFAAFVDGRVVAAGGIQFTPYGAYLAGGSTHPDYRGRGCYRALVHARWEAAVARGTPLLAVQAGKMSKPILERLGFRQIATVNVLIDQT